MHIRAAIAALPEINQFLAVSTVDCILHLCAQGRSISGKITVSNTEYQAQPDTPLASQRLELLGKLAVAQLDIEAVIGELARTGGDSSGARGQVQELIRLQRGIGSASRSDLATMRGEVQSAIAQSQTVVQQAQSASLARVDAAELVSARATSRRALDSAMDYSRQVSLHFDSQEDELAYREREAERRTYIEAQQAKHTPEGDLNAAGAGVGQMVDAKAYGANGPEFDRHWNKLVSTTEKLREVVRRSGGSTKEFDDHLHADLRRIMQSKGLTDAEIDAQFAAHPDSLEAAKAFVQKAGDIGTVQRAVESASNASVASAPASGSASKEISTPNDAASAAAILKSSGVVAANQPENDGAAHGVTINAPAASSAIQRT